MEVEPSKEYVFTGINVTFEYTLADSGPTTGIIKIKGKTTGIIKIKGKTTGIIKIKGKTIRTNPAQTRFLQSVLGCCQSERDIDTVLTAYISLQEGS